MAIHKDFPSSPHSILDPSVRWFPADESLRDTTLEKLLPPLVPELRKLVKEWRDNDYPDISQTSHSLLTWWFKKDHPIQLPNNSFINFQYYFAQRESLETIIFLHEYIKVIDKHDLLRFDTNKLLSSGMFDETWRRYVVKMATGAGKTKVMSLVLVWSYFHKKYETNSDLAKNFLLIAPNIIVLDRLRNDFDGLKIFKSDPVIPENGFNGRDWKQDFQLNLHIQDEVGTLNPEGNIFLTNIHRVYENKEKESSPDDENTLEYFLGKKYKGKTNQNTVDLGDIVRSIDELVVINDEAHHIHDPSLAWHRSIADIHNRLLQKGSKLSLQIDMTATPKDQRGAIFPQTIADYPLVEAITQNVVKHPVLPDQASRTKLQEKQSSVFTEKYGDYIHLGVQEWRKSYAEHQKLGKKSVLFLMTDDTKNCDEVATYLESTYPELQGAVLTIHTNKSGEISEATSGKSKEELDFLRKQANEIDSLSSPYKAIVSVLMLKEGWDVKNVTTIVGLRAFNSPSNILPEQTLGRGLRKMYPIENVEEYVSVVGTDAFMTFVESIQSEGVELERKPMGEGTKPAGPLIVEVDNENPGKNLDDLDIEIPVLTPRIYKEYKNLKQLDINNVAFKPIPYIEFTDAEQRQIIFRDITTGEVTHTTTLDIAISHDYRNVIAYFAQTILRELRLFASYDIIYPKIKEFIENKLFGEHVGLDNLNTLRNLSELEATRTIIESFKKAINKLTVSDKGDAEIQDKIKLRSMRPFVVKDQQHIQSKKSVFNKIVGDSLLELRLAQRLEGYDDVKSFAKNYFQLNFKIEYINANNEISNYYPDFIVKTIDNSVYIIETKGLEDLDDPLKIRRLAQWCKDVNSSQSKQKFDFIYIDQETYDKLDKSSGGKDYLINFESLVKNFRQYKD